MNFVFQFQYTKNVSFCFSFQQLTNTITRFLWHLRQNLMMPIRFEENYLRGLLINWWPLWTCYVPSNFYKQNKVWLVILATYFVYCAALSKIFLFFLCFVEFEIGFMVNKCTNIISMIVCVGYYDNDVTNKVYVDHSSSWPVTCLFCFFFLLFFVARNDCICCLWFFCLFIKE